MEATEAFNLEGTANPIYESYTISARDFFWDSQIRNKL